MKQGIVLPDNRVISWAYSLYTSFHENMVLQYGWKNCTEHDMMLFYSNYNILETEKIIPKSVYSKRITMLRDPVNLYESGYIYYNYNKEFGMDINQFAQVILDENYPTTKLRGRQRKLRDGHGTGMTC